MFLCRTASDCNAMIVWLIFTFRPVVVQGPKRVTVIATGYGFSFKEIKYLIFTFPSCSNKAKRGVAFRRIRVESGEYSTDAVQQLSFAFRVDVVDDDDVEANDFVYNISTLINPM